RMKRRNFSHAKQRGKKGRTMPQMILSVLNDAQRQFKVGLKPKDIHREIASSEDPNVNVARVNSVAWRMWKRGEIERDEQSRYSLPKTDNAVDPLSSQDRPTALEPEAKGREAGPGGGT
ncbi:hypothetical protein, partial [Rhizobium bangladeshense]|uniref:hypothetical protein n=1 Tax=Rhizobium bangladeshense TaxID=1138189 RepID=UPI001AED030A